MISTMYGARWRHDSQEDRVSAADPRLAGRVERTRLWTPKASNGRDHHDKPSIRIIAGDLAPIATQAEGMLIEAGVPLYQRAGTLVRPIIETVDASHGRTTQVAQLKILDSTYMRDLLWH